MATSSVEERLAALDADVARVKEQLAAGELLTVTRDGEPILNEDIIEGAQFILTLPRRRRLVSVLERRSSFIARLDIEGQEHPVAINDTPTGPQVKLRVRNAIISASVCMVAGRMTTRLAPASSRRLTRSRSAD